LISHPLAIDIVTGLLGPGFLISNFTANIALPGSRSMVLHSDQSVVIPEPWHYPWAINIIWCLTDVRVENGATLYLPDSHRATRAGELPADPLSRLKPFEAKSGSVIAMEGRLWHTSGANMTEDEERALLFGYYSKDFIRPQMNWNAALSPETIAALSPEMHTWLGLGANANVKLSVPLAARLRHS
jgi:ectoine hydroxylase-related dioxygenase (phytanoyl-CoA dioxygenase family)